MAVIIVIIQKTKCLLYSYFYDNLRFEGDFYLTFRGPCIVIYSYNNSQGDALFVIIHMTNS